MKIRLALLVLTLAIAAAPASASCFADYKAKRDNPLRLHYGVIELADNFCSDNDAARDDIARRLAANNWKLLAVQSIFGPEGLAEREARAGKFYLRY